MSTTTMICTTKLPLRMSCLTTLTNYVGSKPYCKNYNFVYSVVWQPYKEEEEEEENISYFCGIKYSK